MIRVGDRVLHLLSLLEFRCENKKQERWMNMNHYYVIIKDIKDVEFTYIKLPKY